MAESRLDSFPQAAHGWGIRKCGTQEGHTGFPSLIMPAFTIGFSQRTQARPILVHERHVAGSCDKWCVLADAPHSVHGIDTKTRG